MTTQNMETSDYGDTNLNSIIEGDRRYRDNNEPYGEHGFTQQEFVGEELQDVDEDLDELDGDLDDFEDLDDGFEEDYPDDAE